MIRKPREKMYGNNIKAILKEKLMSPQELSDIIKSPPSHISRIINNQARCISLPIAFKIANALDRPIEEVFIYDEPINQQQDLEDGE